MKKLLFSLAVISAVAVTAQVGINTDEPQAMLDISAKDNQKGDLRIQDVEEKSTQWLLVWDEKDQKVKRTSLSDLKYDMILDKGKINYIRSKQPDRADEIIKKIKQCAPENIVFDKLFGISGKHDFVYCATLVSEGSYNRTWLNLNLGAEYANIHSPHFDPVVNKAGTDAHDDAKTYGSLYQWQRASDGHEFRDSETTTNLAPNWTNVEISAGKFIAGNPNWVEYDRNVLGSDLALWQAGGANNPCPFGYHVPTQEELEQFYKAVTGNDLSYDPNVSTPQIFTQKMLPNLAAAGIRTEEGEVGVRDDDILFLAYWGSTAYGNDINAYSIYISTDYNRVTTGFYRNYGASVRCIKDNN